MGKISNSIKVGKEMIDSFDGSLDGLTEEEIEAKIRDEIEENNLSPMERLRKDNPSLNDAWEQIKTIRGLTEVQASEINKQPSWQRHYFEIAKGVETKNAALKEAWDRYYVLKNLIVPLGTHLKLSPPK